LNHECCNCDDDYKNGPSYARKQRKKERAFYTRLPMGKQLPLKIVAKGNATQKSEYRSRNARTLTHMRITEHVSRVSARDSGDRL
jgi:hypothetical protein